MVEIFVVHVNRVACVNDFFSLKRLREECAAGGARLPRHRLRRRLDCAGGGTASRP